MAKKKAKKVKKVSKKLKEKLDEGYRKMKEGNDKSRLNKKKDKDCECE
jgi:hypothetical protein|tara:strand:- start:922 stop:1065 length:144 start_codon:yes stop_codon:yes gene_type:complete